MRRVTKYYVEESDTRSSDIVGESEPIKKLKNLVDKVAKTEATVLITGKMAGKELVARSCTVIACLQSNRTFALTVILYLRL